jgi:hypothetical protein
LKPTPGARFISARCPRRRFRIRTTGFALSDRIGIANSARQCGSPLPRPAPLLLEPSAEQSPFHAPVALSVVVRAALVAGHLVSLVAPAFPTLQRVFFVPLPTFEHFRARAPLGNQKEVQKVVQYGSAILNGFNIERSRPLIEGFRKTGSHEKKRDDSRNFTSPKQLKMHQSCSHGSYAIEIRCNAP